VRARAPGAKKTFIVPPFPDDCQALKRELNQALEEVIGPSRRDIFLQIAQDEFARKFADFGRLQRTLCFAEPITQTVATGDRQSILVSMTVRSGRSRIRLMANPRAFRKNGRIWFTTWNKPNS